MAKEIILDGKKYREVKDDIKVKVKGQGGVTFIFICSIVLMMVSLYYERWLSLASFLLILLLCGFIGFDGLDDLKKSITAHNLT